jgi:possible flavodoxin
MSNVAVVYWSQTGNTEAMANALAEAAGTEAIEYSSFSADQASDYDAFAFGCPAMGAEELDPDFEELFDDVVAAAPDKPFVLFGSYDWGTGEWMETWKASAEEQGANVIATIIANLEPDSDALDELEQAGKKLAE